MFTYMAYHLQSIQSNETVETLYCDATVIAIEKITNNSFGYKEKSGINEKNAVIQKVREWWPKQIKKNDGLYGFYLFKRFYMMK